MSKIEARIEELGITLPEASAPVGNYVGAKVVGNMVYLSGNGPLGNADSAFKGKVGSDFSLKEGYAAARNYHEDIAQVTATLLSFDHRILIANSDGLYTQDRQIRTRMRVNAVASKNGENQSGSCSPGRRMGLELFDLYAPADIGKEAARQAVK